ncbi:Enamine deaminase RidA, house cleaning of reactive enamine intermediates, YjgF/YER057c/UK114 family [Oryzisolibacter propanilivorax]|uniref:Enamine deaminase RidA, house cleaning of reactive enamine intermediates, YjgF/YER057c/UK114 family n=1 Tax=Oryzisolibacter propanilivorax TaxID=1527607 RepID=A0A1G9PKP0_9BURK|nr:RidA family protein [Oryzisolibacter propanilivorax]SDL98665.1 Enamine deaminase RidA, house cleaning of reactive enamine intermediates, YjgF/YER057c/UK114 family [Oryzisolibacter propanilivorax]
MNADQRFDDLARRLGYSFDGEIKIGGNYTPLVVDVGVAYVSGQVPRVGDSVVVTGRVGAEVSLEQAQLAARICALRALALLRRQFGSLEQVSRILRITVFVQCTESFTLHSEVADGASAVLFDVLGEAGRHSRTSVGVFQLPKNASVELDLMASTKA